MFNKKITILLLILLMSIISIGFISASQLDHAQINSDKDISVKVDNSTVINGSLLIIINLQNMLQLMYILIIKFNSPPLIKISSTVT